MPRTSGESVSASRMALARSGCSTWQRLERKKARRFPTSSLRNRSTDATSAAMRSGSAWSISLRVCSMDFWEMSWNRTRAGSKLPRRTWYSTPCWCKRAARVNARTTSSGSWSSIQHHGLSAFLICSSSVPRTSVEADESSRATFDANRLRISASRSWLSMQRRRMSAAFGLRNGLIRRAAPRTILYRSLSGKPCGRTARIWS